MRRSRIGALFSRISKWLAHAAGEPWAFVGVLFAIAAWGCVGPLFRFNAIWQLTLGTVASVVALLMVFLIQNTQKRDTQALQIKIDELIRATRGAHTVLLDLEELDPDELEAIRKRYRALAERSRALLRSGQADTETFAVPDFEHIRKVEERQAPAPPHVAFEASEHNGRKIA